MVFFKHVIFEFILKEDVAPGVRHWLVGVAGRPGATFGTGDVVAIGGWGNQNNTLSEGDQIIPV